MRRDSISLLLCSLPKNRRAIQLSNQASLSIRSDALSLLIWWRDLRQSELSYEGTFISVTRIGVTI